MAYGRWHRLEKSLIFEVKGLMKLIGPRVWGPEWPRRSRASGWV